MPIPVTCPGCNATMRVADEAAGKAVKCRQCGSRVPVPAADEDQTALKAGQPERRAGRTDDRDDDDDRKARPSKKGGSGKIMAIIAGVLVAACCVCSGIGGGVYWGVRYAFNKGKDALVQADKQFHEKAKQFQDDMKKAEQEMEKARQDAMEKAKDKDKAKEFAKEKETPKENPKIGPPKGNFVFEQRETLTKNDPKIKDLFGGTKPAKIYRVKLDAGTQYVIDMVHHGDGDPYLVLLDPKGKELARDDDGGGLLNSRIRYRPTVTGDYTIQATCLSEFSLGPTGMVFTLTVRRE